jgi:succinyl-CoA synthetase beta subunit
MVSAAGGIDIEEVAATTPEKILYLPVDPRYGLLPFEALRMGFFLYSDAKLARSAGEDHAAALHRRSWPPAARWPRSTRWW